MCELVQKPALKGLPRVASVRPAAVGFDARRLTFAGRRAHVLFELSLSP